MKLWSPQERQRSVVETASKHQEFENNIFGLIYTILKIQIVKFHFVLPTNIPCAAKNFVNPLNFVRVTRYLRWAQLHRISNITEASTKSPKCRGDLVKT